MSQHPRPDQQPVKGPDDLERNPGIGQSAGLSRRDGLEELEGENTVEGDIENDVGPNGQVTPDHRGRDH
ncbi:MAG TPA: hypothetical protein VEA15_12050 [Caulobacteraceae bacterium]|nr:hypothetical protein [Caulobacteraceae bacterium]